MIGGIKPFYSMWDVGVKKVSVVFFLLQNFGEFFAIFITLWPRFEIFMGYLFPFSNTVDSA